jgi:nucleoid-associated protein YgaU
MDFEYRFYDRYNWDRGKQTPFVILTVKDEDMGRLHRVGLAREFDVTGTVTFRVEWTKGKAGSRRPIPGTRAIGPTPGTPRTIGAPAPNGALPVPATQASPAAVLPPQPAPHPLATRYVVRPGDSLSLIAERVYGDVTLWVRIYNANRRSIGPNPNHIRPGQNLVLPPA